MFEINIENLKKTADQMEKNALRYKEGISKLESTIIWMKNQNFKEVEELRRSLSIQNEKMHRQMHILMMLSEIMRNICYECERTEQKIAEYEFYGQKMGQIGTINLKQVQNYLQTLGLHIKGM